MHCVSAESFEKNPDLKIIIVRRQRREIAGMMDSSFDKSILNQVFFKTHSDILSVLNLNIISSWQTDLKVGSWMNLWPAKTKMLKHHQNFGHDIQVCLLQKDLPFLIWAAYFCLTIIWSGLQMHWWVVSMLFNRLQKYSWTLHDSSWMYL